MMKKVNDVIFTYILNNAVKLFGMALLFIICLQIYGRSFMATPPSWTEEMSRFTFVWYCFLSTAITLRAKAHLGLDYFYRKFSPKVQTIIDWLIQLIILDFGLFIIYYGIPLLAVVGNRKAAITGWNMKYFYMVMPICGFFLALVALEGLEALIEQAKETKMQVIDWCIHVVALLFALCTVIYGIPTISMIDVETVSDTVWTLGGFHYVIPVFGIVLAALLLKRFYGLYQELRANKKGGDVA